MELNELSACSNRFSAQTSQYCVRAQIVAFYSSLNFLLDDIPSVRQSHFGQTGETGSAADLRPEPRYNQNTSPPFKHCKKYGLQVFKKRQKQENELKRNLLPDRTDGPQQLLSADGKTLLNLWFLPHYSEVLHMFKTLNASVRC